MKNELKPCPFCGGEASLRDEPDRYYKYTVYCTKCGIGTPIVFKFSIMT